MVRNPLMIPKNIRMKRRPYTKELSWAYKYKVVDADQRKEAIFKSRQKTKTKIGKSN